MADKQLSDQSFIFYDVITHDNGKTSLDFRFLHKFKFVEALLFEIHQKNTKGRTIHRSEVSPRETHENPWVYRKNFNLKIVSGTIDVVIRVGGQAKATQTILFGKTLQKKAVVVQEKPPRLILSLASTPQGNPVSNETNVNERLLKIMGWITDRLNRELDETLWLGPDSGRGLDIDELYPSSKDNDRKNEELWARRITEILIAQPYALPSTSYRFSGDSDVYKEMSHRISNNRDVFYPITVQCQQSCTIALLSRGVPFELMAPGGCNAGNTESLPVFKSAHDGHWHKGDKFKQAKHALDATPSAGPGSLFEFFDRKKGANSPGAHIGFLLRTRNKGWYGVQTFDTGGLNAPARARGVDVVSSGSGLGGGLFDDPWVKTVVGSGQPFSGMGVLSSKFKPVKNWGSWAPLAYARLVLINIKDNEVLYASPLLATFHKSVSYSVAKYAWSLRALPFGDEIKAIWQLSVPRSKLAKAALKATRDTAVSEILSLSKVDKDKKIVDNFNHLINTIDIESTDDGDIRIKRIFVNSKDGKGNRIDKFPWGVRSQSKSHSVAVDLDKIPEYLVGEQK